MELLIILETSVPTKFPYKQGYQFHSKIILPIVGKLFSKDKVAYSYLSESASVFPYGDQTEQYFTKYWVYKCGKQTANFWRSNNLHSHQITMKKTVIILVSIACCTNSKGTVIW